MPDRLVYTLRTAVASNTGGPYVTIWDRAAMSSAGTIRNVVAVAGSLTSNARVNTVELYRQADAPSVGSNTAATVLVTPITLSNTNDAVTGTVRAANDRVARGDQLQLRTDAGTTGPTAALVDLTLSVEIERDDGG